MRHKKVKNVTIGVIVILVLAGLTFAVLRSEGEHTHEEAEEHEHGEEAVREEAEHPAEAPGEHAEEGEHPAEHAPEHEAEPARSPVLSGTMIEGVRVIEMTARQFEFDPSRVVVNEGEKVRLEITSQDVIHGVALPAFDIDNQLDPGETVRITFTAGVPGEYPFRCSRYCGEGHSGMRGTLVVLGTGE
jgi:cytochrome c oxidase subunit 2